MIGRSCFCCGGWMEGINWIDLFNAMDRFLLAVAQQYGAWVYATLAFIFFSETGLVFMAFLPGDSLLFVAGILVAAGGASMPNIVVTCLLLTAAAIAGNATGYAIGAKVGPALFDRPDSRIFKPEYLDKTHEFFEKYGAPAIILARFVPIVRTFITAVAGAGRMGFARFMVLSAIGGVLWATGLTLMGYWLGNVDVIRHNVEAIAIVIVIVSVLPIVVEAMRKRRA